MEARRKRRLVLNLENALVENGVQAARQGNRPVGELLQQGDVAVENTVLGVVDLTSLFQVGMGDRRAYQMLGHGVGGYLGAKGAGISHGADKKARGVGFASARSPDQKHMLPREQSQFELLDALVVSDEMLFKRVERLTERRVAHWATFLRIVASRALHARRPIDETQGRMAIQRLQQ